MAPEVYDDGLEGKKVRDMRTDVFSFRLILHELLTGQKTFPKSLSVATIMRKALSARAKDRPQIPDTVHVVLRELISGSWQPSLAKRPTMSIIWQRMREVDFHFFPSGSVLFTPVGSWTKAFDITDCHS
jgi:hypothetical protein